MTDAGREFQTDSAAHRKECFSKSVRANGWMDSASRRIGLPYRAVARTEERLQSVRD